MKITMCKRKIARNKFHHQQKLLLMKTYYDLTKDEDFKTLFDTFEGVDNYEVFREIVFGKNKTLKPDHNA